ncbi:MAG: nucleotide exchange factor GrpE [Actinomycetia bacterium]|nr:nucleotide exchange factor GrpE [Actinomycetes bacterium]
MTEEQNKESRIENQEPVLEDPVTADESTVAIAEVPEIGHTAETLGIELPESREECEKLLIRELGEARLEADELLGNLQRVTAEFDNYRKRTERDRVENVRRAGQRVIESLLPVLDSIDAAMAIDAATPTEAKMLEGMTGTHAQLLEALSRDGFAEIDAVGAPFDPALHEAISVIPGEGEQVVDQEVRKGYVMGGRVIRPSLVVVGHA